MSKDIFFGDAHLFFLRLPGASCPTATRRSQSGLRNRPCNHPEPCFCWVLRDQLRVWGNYKSRPATYRELGL